jgi:hypothetical protein
MEEFPAVRPQMIREHDEVVANQRDMPAHQAAGYAVCLTQAF